MANARICWELSGRHRLNRLGILTPLAVLGELFDFLINSVYVRNTFPIRALLSSLVYQYRHNDLFCLG